MGLTGNGTLLCIISVEIFCTKKSRLACKSYDRLDADLYFIKEGSPMRLASRLGIFTLFLANLCALPANDAAAQSTPEVGVKARCVANSTRALTGILKEKVTALYTQAGHTKVVVVVSIRAQRGALTSVKFANLVGVTGVAFKTDAASGAQLTTNATPIAASCAVEGTASIKVTYLPSGSVAGTPRKTVTTTQTVSLDGSFL
jgi:hypothetical protein